MNKAVHRILTFIEHLNISARQFDLSIGTANGYTLRMYKNNASIGSDVIERIVKTYPQINLVWLITGKGSMFIEVKEPKTIDNDKIEAFIQEQLNKKWSEEKKELLNEIMKEINEQLKK
jgi:hypothetical protein